MNKPAFWDGVLQRIKNNTSEFSFNNWFQCINNVYTEDSTLHLELPNTFSRNWMIENFSAIIKEALFAELGEEYQLKFHVSAPSKEVAVEQRREVEEKPAKTKKTFRISRTSLESQTPVLNHNYKFDSFVVGSSNRFAHAAAVAVSKSPAQSYNPLFIYGGVGLGKTHLMQAIGNKILTENSDARVHFVSTEIFTNQLIDAIQNRHTVKFRKKYRSVDILLIDDIQFLSGKEQTQEEFFHTFNTLYDAHKQIVITSDRAPKDIEFLEDRLISRFEWGLVTDLQPPDIETRIAILRKKAESSGILVPDDVIFFLADRITSNIRKLEGALIRISSYASLTESKINLKLTEEILRDTIEIPLQKAVSSDKIQQFIAQYYDIRIHDLLGKKRTQTVSLPRQIAMYLCRILTTQSYPEIGKCFGNRDHTTVLHAFNKIENDIKKDETLKKTIDMFISKIKS